MDHGRVHQTPTGYGVITIDARKEIIVPTVNVPSLAQAVPARRAALKFGVVTTRVAPAQ